MILVSGRCESEFRFDLAETGFPALYILKAVPKILSFFIEGEPLLCGTYGADLPSAVLANEAQQTLMVFCQRRPV